MPPYSRANPDKLEIDGAHSPAGTHTATAKPESQAPQSPAGKKRNAGALKLLFQKLGPGLITGASDDDPSGIATYSQVGAQFGYGLLWTMVLILTRGTYATRLSPNSLSSIAATRSSNP